MGPLAPLRHREFRLLWTGMTTYVGWELTEAAFIPFAYRISGLLEPPATGWRWRHCHGCEPTPG